MAVLRLLEGIRNPALDEIFLFITKMGEETIFIILGLMLFWCISKKQGYYLLSVGFIGIMINQFLKITFRVPRPWIQDESFTIVEKARKGAEGFSFPSGHTQMSVGIFGALAKANKKPWIRIVSIALCILVPFSRMYLGVHTPYDVAVSAACALILIFLLYPIAGRTKTSEGLHLIFCIMTIFAVFYLCYTKFFPFALDKTEHNYISALSNAYKTLGCTIGIFCGYETDERFTRFETRAVWYVQIIKFVIGTIGVIFIKSLLKAPLYAVFNGLYFADTVRYFMILYFVVGIWPMTFKLFGKIR